MLMGEEIYRKNVYMLTEKIIVSDEELMLMKCVKKYLFTKLKLISHVTSMSLKARKKEK